MLKYLRWFLWPFSLLYGCAILIRNGCYNAGILKSTVFNIPIIAVGNLDVGGAGKSPMAEYMIRLFKSHYKLAILSRGYGRQTQGFLIAATDISTARQLGDEPAQFKQKFPDITVSVCEDRVYGINQLKDNHELIILDDAYQHRAVKPGLSILLFDYSRVFEPQLLLPAGNLREPFAGRKRADIIMVTKCPEYLTVKQQQEIQLRLRLYPKQQIFFTCISYNALQTIDGINADKVIEENAVVFLLTGIANPTPLINQIKRNTKQIIHHNYPDHHQYTLKNIAKLADEFNACAAVKKIIVTTEKDAQRLREQELLPLVKQMPFLVMPIAVTFLANGNQFDQLTINYVREHTTNH